VRTPGAASGHLGVSFFLVDEESSCGVGVSSPFLPAETRMISGMDQRKPGRPSKGQRTMLTTRVPLPTKDDASHRAAELKMTLNDYVAWLIEQDVAEHPTHDPESELELGRTA
jgi:hypothetical protein